MNPVSNGCLESLLRGDGELPRSRLTWLNELRSEALERANALAVPTTRDEDWRFTDLSPLYKTMLQPVLRPAQVEASAIEACFIPEASSRLVFVDGVYSATYSSTTAEDGVTVNPLAAALAGHGEELRSHIGRLADFRTDPFTAVNTAWLRDGALVTVQRDCAVSRPVHLLFVSASPGTVANPRVLVTAATGAQCTVIEEFVSVHAGAGLANGVTEIAVGAEAQVRHIRQQREPTSAFHIGTCAVRVGRNGRYQGVTVTLGGRISRYNLNVTQAGEGTECQVDGLALISGRQVADTHSFLDHAFAHGRSRQTHKCIVGGAAHAVFNGKILVRPGAQLTDAAQQSRNLLLSDRARVDTKPQLEIFADDVKCAHGATVGQLDAEQTFYLRSRGLSDTAARNLLTFAFGAEVIQRIEVASLVARLQDVVLRATQH